MRVEMRLKVRRHLLAALCRVVVEVVRVARKGDQPLRHVARDFGISESCLHR